METWIKSATLILLARTAVKNNFNYKALFVKRSSKSSFMPEAYVFPGGAFEAADADKQWLDIFQRAGKDAEVKALLSAESTKPYVLQCEPEEQVERDISLRVTAIRETFEETGILLCKQNNNELVQECDTERWRKEIMHKPEKFIDMCFSLNMYPDIWQLHSWSNWLTPATIYTKRFNTLFFLSFVNEIPDSASADSAEVTHVNWCTPWQCLHSFYNKSIILHPPQIYELARLLNFEDASNLLYFARLRAKKGVPVTFPKLYQLSDGLISVYPGDDLYPDKPDYTVLDKLETINQSLKESSTKCWRVHRSETRDRNNISVVAKGVTPRNGHVQPVQVQPEIFS